MSKPTPVNVRFAPSPTGRLHVGNIRTALMNWLFAHKMKGSFLLRLDDTDLERSSEAFADGIREDLHWLGLDWDREARQSKRFARYDGVVEELKAAGRLYPCYETPDELARKRKRQRARAMPPIYDRAGYYLSDSERRALEKEGRKPHWRFLLHNFGGDPRDMVPTNVAWHDLIRGEQRIDISSLSDPVLIRADGTYLYTLPSVIDDIDYGITHIVRGEDHVANTAAQLQIFSALGADLPQFAHHSLLVGADGQALSKRLGSLSVQSFRELGLEALAVASHSTTIGTSDPVSVFPSLDALSKSFSFDKISRAPVRFDLDELRSLNAKLLHGMEFCDVADRLAAMGIACDEEFWVVVRENIERLADTEIWWQVVRGSIEADIEDRALLAAAKELLPDEPWARDTWKVWTDAIKERTGKKGRALFHPLRVALTGLEKGPELKALLPLIGRARVLERLG